MRTGSKAWKRTSRTVRSLPHRSACPRRNRRRVTRRWKRATSADALEPLREPAGVLLEPEPVADLAQDERADRRQRDLHVSLLSRARYPPLDSGPPAGFRDTDGAARVRFTLPRLSVRAETPWSVDSGPGGIDASGEEEP